ncbi:MAG: hypothetical protein LBP72_00625 [Dysgonamonadaceae bacterium]|jgi:hypothetical protein|nr:hypothetical protein [Dysgonamonadaceae bacterium]
MLTTVKAYYDGTAFVPVIPVDVQEGTIFTLSVSQPEEMPLDKAKKLKAFKLITENLRKINKEEPLPPLFDEILSQRTKFETDITL